MTLPARSVTWEALAHSHAPKGSDWFWVLGIISLSASVASFFFGNFLLAILIILSGAIFALIANREPQIVAYAVTSRGLRVGDTLYPYSTLEAYYINDEDPERGPQLLARSERMFMHLIVIPLPEDYVDEVEHILAERLPEEYIEEPFATKVLEIFGF